MERSGERTTCGTGDPVSAEESVVPATPERLYSSSSLAGRAATTPGAEIAAPATGPGVAVIIAAYNAEATIKAAIDSALRQREVVEVVVVDDGSRDRTGEVARGCDDGTGRLRLVRQENAGPSVARNVGLATTSAPLWCVLDADDTFAPGRFRRLFEEVGYNWDMAADGVEFHLTDGSREYLDAASGGVRHLSLAAFVSGNVSRRKRPRCELGYLQPVKRRAFFEAHRLHFDGAVRFAEDYALYTRALACGARFVCIGSPGYIANVTPGSLSHSQTAADYESLIRFDREMLTARSPAEQRAFRRHMRMMRLKAAALKVEAALGERRFGAALAHAFRDHHCAGFVFNHRYRPRLARVLKRWAGLDPHRELFPSAPRGEPADAADGRRRGMRLVC